MDNRRSLLHFYSYGRAAENKALDSKFLEVTPIEMVPFMDGEITTNEEDMEDTGVDHEGKSYSVKVTAATSIKCEWMPYGSNRLTAPDIRRGERIIILRYGDVDKFYWIPDGRDEQLRRLETVIWRFSDSISEEDKEITDDNSYSFTVSTHEQHITLKTCKNNQEPFAYTIQVNTKEGIIVMADDVGNFFELNSRDTILTLQNKENSRLILDKTIAHLITTDEINFETKVMNIKAVDINTQATNITTKSTNITTDATTIATTASNYNVTATISFTGGTSITGAVSTTGTLTNNGKDVGSPHTHTAIKLGDPTSPPL